ncbi:MAG: hypothetical protein M3N22_11155 [Acidobacteriota bacterium]|nr:hypothetical protein [Acidobacteriota bacterium]
MKQFLQNLFRRGYVALLEEEVARLRMENRGLTNSLLGTAGFPPVDFQEPVKPQALSRVRKRSWHQIQMQREQNVSREAGLDVDERTNGLVSHN